MNQINIDNDICIRPCRAEDISIAYKIDKQHMPIKTDLQSLQLHFKRNPDLFYVAIDSRSGAGIDGIVGYTVGTGFYPPSWYSKEMSGYISRLVVLPEYRERGVGKMLVHALEYALSLYRKYKTVYVETPKINDSAIRFYESLGYVHDYDLDDPEGYERELPDNPEMVGLVKPLLPPDQYKFNACVFL